MNLGNVATGTGASALARIEISVLKLIGVWINWTKDEPPVPLVNLSFSSGEHIVKRTLGEDAGVVDEASAEAVAEKARVRLRNRMTVIPVTGAIGVLDRSPEAKGAYKLASASLTDPIVLHWKDATKAAPTLDASSVDDM